MRREFRNRAGCTTFRQIRRCARHQAAARSQLASNHTLILDPAYPYDKVPAFLDNVNDAIAETQIERQRGMELGKAGQERCDLADAKGHRSVHPKRARHFDPLGRRGRFCFFNFGQDAFGAFQITSPSLGEREFSCRR